MHFFDSTQKSYTTITLMKRTILLVDDDPFFRFMHERLLLAVRPDFEIRMTEDGAQALEDIHACIAGERNLPDYILLDSEMPGMNGREFLEAYRTLIFPGKERIQIVLVSTSADPIPLSGYEQYKIMSFTKPIRIDQLKEIIFPEPMVHALKKH